MSTYIFIRNIPTCVEDLFITLSHEQCFLALHRSAFPFGDLCDGGYAILSSYKITKVYNLSSRWHKIIYLYLILCVRLEKQYKYFFF